MATSKRRAKYKPQPIDTTGILIPDSLRELSEALAVNAHEVWAAQRLSDDWHYGPERNDNTKLHPCLIPYDELPEKEKEYDRRLVKETICAILALGYQILPPEKRGIGDRNFLAPNQVLCIVSKSSTPWPYGKPCDKQRTFGYF